MPKSMHLLAAVAAIGLAGGAAAATKPVKPVSASSATAPKHASAKASKPKFSMSQARKIAKQAAPGKIIKTALAQDRYVFDIKQKHNVQEVAVDANTGKVVENHSEGRTDRDKGKKE